MKARQGSAPRGDAEGTAELRRGREAWDRRDFLAAFEVVSAADRGGFIQSPERARRPTFPTSRTGIERREP